MTRWKQEEPSRETARMRDWLETDAGKAYRERRHRTDYMRKWRAEHKDQNKASQKRAYDNMRLECLQHYSGEVPSCACCGETEIVFLHIDHIDGNGADHRRTLKSELGYYPGGNNLPYWLKKNNWPEGFQILCANCNLAKRVNNICPHELRRREAVAHNEN